MINLILKLLKDNFGGVSVRLARLKEALPASRQCCLLLVFAGFVVIWTFLKLKHKPLFISSENTCL